jgi:DNA-binding MarR family transcriptional regulator
MKPDRPIDNPSDELADSFLFQVIRLKKAIFRRSNQLINEAGINLKFDQLPFILILQKNPMLSQRELAEIILRDKSSVLRSISALENKKLLLIEQDHSDKRRNNISLTEQGTQMAVTVRALMKKAENEVLSVFTAEERKIALNTLRSYADKLEKQ